LLIIFIAALPSTIVIESASGVSQPLYLLCLEILQPVNINKYLRIELDPATVSCVLYITFLTTLLRLQMETTKLPVAKTLSLIYSLYKDMQVSRYRSGLNI